MQAATFRFHSAFLRLHHSLSRLGVAMGAFLFAAGLLLWGLSPAAWAHVTISTDFPGISVQAGDNKSISLTLHNYSETGQNVDLDIVDVPEGWDATLRARGSIVHRAWVGPRSNDRPGSTFLNLELTVPRTAPEGDHRVAVKAGSEILDLSIRVTHGAAAGSVELTTQYPQLRGPSGAEFQFPVSLVNRTGEDQTFQLMVEGPRDWQIQITPRFENKQIASIGVQDGSTERLEVKVIPSRRAGAGEYPILLRAIAPNGEAVLPLTTVITGVYDMRLTTPTGRLNAEVLAGREGPLTLVVENTGSSDLHNVSLSGTVPPNWNISFEPDHIDRLAPGEFREVTAKIRPHDRAIAGDYVAVLNARAAEASASSTIRVSVQTPTVWGWVGVGVVAVALAGLLGTFRIYGRR